MPSRLRLPVIVWLAVVVLIGLAVGLGYVLPAGTEMIYQNTFDMRRLRISSIVLRDMSRQIDGHLTERFGVNALAKWSPDGQQIAYLTLNDTMFRVYIMDALGRNKRRLALEFTTLDSGFVWSPDSRYILFSVTIAGVPQSLVLNVANGQTELLPQAIGQGIWSPYGQMILYQASTENGTSHLYGMNIQCLANGQSCQFHQLDMLRDQPTYDNFIWSPDGQSIAFSQVDQGGDTKIIVASLRCSDLSDACIKKYVTVGKGPLVRSPIWSPDSQQVAYVSGADTLSVVRLSSGESHVFNTPDILPTLKDWSPDGRYIAYFSTQRGGFNVYLLDTLSAEVQPLFAHQTTNELPEWRPTLH